MQNLLHQGKRAIHFLRTDFLKRSSFLNTLWYGSLVLVSLLFLGIYYGAYAHFGYVSAPGGDLYNHAVSLANLQTQGISAFFTDYPKFFHLLVWVLMKVTGLPFLRVTLYLVPVVMLATGLANAWVARLIAGKVAGLLTLLLLLFAATQPWQTLYDGGFPNIIAAGIWLPLWIGSVIQYDRRKHGGYLFAVLLFAFLVVATHHISTAYLAILGLVLFCYKLRHFRWWMGISTGVGLLGFLAFFARPLQGLLGTIVVFSPDFPWLHIIGSLSSADAIWTYRQYITGIGSFILFTGIFGIIFLSRNLWCSAQNRLGSLLVLTWLLALLIGSRLDFLGFPVRLARDAGLPLAMSAAIALVGLWKLAGWIAIRLVELLTRFIIIALSLYLLFDPIKTSLRRILNTYEPTMQYSGADQAVVDAVDDSPAASLDHQLPSLMRPTIYVLGLHAPPRGAWEQGDNQAQLKGKHYVFYEVSKNGGYDGEVYRGLLQEHGYREIAHFADPLKVVYLFKQENSLLPAP